MLNNLKILTGYDNRGTVYDSGESVIREINPKYIDEVKYIYSCYEKFNLKSLGIVETDLILDKENSYLKHKKYPISYPHEWTANMFKDAALLYLNLFVELDKFGLTLKDAIPSNIVFDFNKPVFVDFLSIVPTEKLKEEDWLFVGGGYQKDARFTVFEKMFFPFIFLPLIMHREKKYSKVRDILFNKACNSRGGVKPVWEDVFECSGIRSFIFSSLEKIKLKSFFRLKKRLGFIAFCKECLDLLEKVDVTPKNSGYDSYYSDKKENFSFEDKSSWKSKQMVVYNAIKKYKPKTVLDLGANTGWFSILAEKEGARVISTDIDESSIDSLYTHSRKNNLNILSLLLSFDDLEKELFGITMEDSVYQDRDFGNNPLFSSAKKRIKVDFILCLALAHHLILGEGKKIEKVFRLLSDLTSSVLVLEFVGLNDSLILNHGSFFKNLKKYNESNYNLDLFVNVGKKYFSDVEILDSHPITRKLLVFKK